MSGAALQRQASRFLVVGGLTVLIDFAVYHGLLLATLSPSPAKALSFIAGALFAYFANGRFTFETAGNSRAFMLFWCVYLVNLGVNVAMNKLALTLLAGTAFAITMAFVFATAVSAMLNFLGLKFLVFRPA